MYKNGSPRAGQPASDLQITCLEMILMYATWLGTPWHTVRGTLRSEPINFLDIDDVYFVRYIFQHAIATCQLMYWGLKIKMNAFSEYSIQFLVKCVWNFLIFYSNFPPTKMLFSSGMMIDSVWSS